MKIDVTTLLHELDGSPIEVSAPGAGQTAALCAECAKIWREMMQPLTLRLVCTRALTRITAKSVELSPDEKFERGQLAHKIYNEDSPSLGSGDIQRVKAAIGEVDGPLVLMQAWNLLERTDED